LRIKKLFSKKKFNRSILYVKVRVDGDRKAEAQINDVLKKLPGILALKKCEIIGVLTGTLLLLLLFAFLSNWNEIL
jgi:hypothetical protein